MTLADLFVTYGWQLAIVGFIGTLVVGLLKKPINLIFKKKQVVEGAAEKFDTLAFILGVIIAIILGCIYTVLAWKFCWVYSGSGEDRVVAEYSFTVYISNSVGTWLYQIGYYQIWKKLGIKRLLSIIGKACKAAADKNNDGKVDITETTSLISGLLKNGKLNIEEVLATVSSVVPTVAQEVISTVETEMGTDGVIDVNSNVDKLSDIAQDIVSKIPQKDLNNLATSLTEKAEDKVKAIAAAPTPTADTNRVPTRPTIKF